MPAIAADESFSRDTVAQLRAEGIVSLGRYVDGSEKGLSASELKVYVDAGISVFLFKETFEQAASLGYNQGRAEARAAFAAHFALGLPLDRPIYFVAEDPRPVPLGVWGSIADYFRGVADEALASGRPLQGAYGSGLLCRHLVALGLIQYECHVSTWPGLDRAAAHIVQEANGIAGHSNLGGTIDLDSLRPDTADWGQFPFNPQPLETSTMLYICDMPGRETGVWLTDGIVKRPTNDGAVWSAAGAIRVSLTEGDFNELRDIREDERAAGDALGQLLTAIANTRVLDISVLADAVARAIHISVDAKTIAADVALELSRRLAVS